VASQVVAELQQRSKQVAFEAAALTSQRQQLAALDAQRRAAIRAIEDSLATAGARLDDRAKEEKLRQIRLAEEAYQVTAHAAHWGLQPLQHGGDQPLCGQSLCSHAALCLLRCAILWGRQEERTDVCEC
jgi:hypothetical protein